MSVLQEATQLNYYTLRASICEHLLDPIYDVPEEVDGNAQSEEMTMATIRACSDFINKEHPTQYIKKLVSPKNNDCKSNSSKKKKDLSTSSNSSIIPAHVSSPDYPLLLHMDIWLLLDDIWRVVELVRSINASPALDGMVKETAWLHVWQYLLRQGKIFLDGNVHSPGYFQKRELLYNGVVSGMAYYGRASMIDFYHALAEKVWNHPDSTQQEKQYVLVACQQTVLRLLFKCCGLGPETVGHFLKTCNKWPVHLGANGMTDLEQWAAEFLRPNHKIPESLLNQDNVIDLQRLTEGEKEAKADDMLLLEDGKAETMVSPMVLQDVEAVDDGDDDEEPVINIGGDDEEEVEVLQQDEAQNALDIYGVEEADDDAIEVIDDSDETNEIDGDEEDIAVEGVHEGEYDNAQLEDDVVDEDEDEDDDDSDDDDDDDDEEEGIVNDYTLETHDSEQDDLEEDDEEVEVVDGSGEEDVDIEEDDARDDFSGDVSENDDDIQIVEGEEEVADEYPTTYEPATAQQEEIFDEQPVGQDNEETHVNATEAIAALQGHMGAGQEEASNVEISSPKREEATIELLDSSPEKDMPSNATGEQNTAAQSSREQPRPLENDYPQSTEAEGKASKDDDDVDSDATDDEQERVQEVEKAETEVAAVGGEFGDTTEEEDDIGEESSKANLAAQADRRADVLRSKGGYASQLEEGYEPEDTHGYTEEELSEAIHTEDEVEERRPAQPPQNSRVVDVDYSHQNDVGQNSVEPASHNNAHSSDDMDAADEHTEPEEDLGAESSELEETTEGPPRVQEYVSYSPSSEYDRDPTTLLEFAQSAQRRHESIRSRVPNPTKSPVPQHHTDLETGDIAEEQSSRETRRASEPSVDKSVAFVDLEKPTEHDAAEGSKDRELEENVELIPTRDDKIESAENTPNKPGTSQEVAAIGVTETVELLSTEEEDNVDHQEESPEQAEAIDPLLSAEEGKPEAGNKVESEKHELSTKKSTDISADELDGAQQHVEVAMEDANNDEQKDNSSKEPLESNLFLNVASGEVEKDGGTIMAIDNSEAPDNSMEVEGISASLNPVDAMHMGESDEAMDTDEPKDIDDAEMEADDAMDTGDVSASDVVMETKDAELKGRPDEAMEDTEEILVDASAEPAKVHEEDSPEAPMLPTADIALPTIPEDAAEPVSEGPTTVRKSKRTAKRANVDEDDASVTSTGSRRRSARTKSKTQKTQGDDAPVSSTDSRPRRSTRASKTTDTADEEKEIRTAKRARGRAKQDAYDGDASLVSTAIRASPQSEEEEKPKSTKRGRKTAKTEKDANEDDAAEVSTASRASRRATHTSSRLAETDGQVEKPKATKRGGRKAKTEDEEKDNGASEVPMTSQGSRQTRSGSRKVAVGNAKEKPKATGSGLEKDDGAPVVRRSTRSGRKAEADKEEEKPKARKRGPRKAQIEVEENGDDESVVSTASRASRRSTRSGHKAVADDEGEKTKAPKRGSRMAKAEDGGKDDDESVASTANRTGRPTRATRKAKTENKEVEALPQKKRGRAAGKPPLPSSPTRTSTRTRKKKEFLDFE